jgi:hypothetical protein
VGRRLSGRSGRSVGRSTVRLGRHRRSFPRSGLGRPRTPRRIAAPRATPPPLHPTGIRDTSDCRLQPSASRGGRDPCLPHPEAGSAASRSPLARARTARRGKTPVQPHLPPWTGIPGARGHHRPMPRPPPRAPRPRRSIRRPGVPPPPTRLGMRLRGVPRFPGSLSERGRLGGGPPIPRGLATCGGTSKRPVAGPPINLRRLRQPCAVTAMRTRPGPGLFAVLRRWSPAGTCSATWTLQPSGRGRRRSGIRWRSRGPRSRLGGRFRDPRFGGRDPPAAVTARAATVRMAGPGGAAAGWCLLRRRRRRGRGGGGSGSWRWC